VPKTTPQQERTMTATDNARIPSSVNIYENNLLYCLNLKVTLEKQVDDVLYFFSFRASNTFYNFLYSVTVVR